MGGSFTIGRVRGIDVRIHWSFFLLPLFVGFLTYQRSGGSAVVTAFSIALILGLFVCVLLHEFGHSVIAQRLGIEVPNITLLPIGGVANLKKMPEKPMDEVKVAIAGPLVNVVLGPLFIALSLAAGGGLSRVISLQNLDSPTVFLLYLGAMNVALVVFNMLPAFPMDGGRVLRGLLATRLGAVRATNIASTIGQVSAFAIGIGGLLIANNPFFILIGLFIFFGASGEAQMVRQRETMRGVTVGDVMGTKRRTETVGPYNNLAQVMDSVLHGYQEDFPVVQEDGRLVGMLTRNEIVPAANDSSRQFSDVRQLMRTEFPTISPDADLFEEGNRLLQESGMKAIPVVKDGELNGMLTAEDISQANLIRHSFSRR